MFVHAQLLSCAVRGSVFNSDTKWHQQKQQLHQTGKTVFLLTFGKSLIPADRNCSNTLMWFGWVWETCQGWLLTPSESSRCFLNYESGEWWDLTTPVPALLLSQFISVTLQIWLSPRNFLSINQVSVLFHPLHSPLLFTASSPSLHFSEWDETGRVVFCK